MSRIGKMPIVLADGVKAEVNNLEVKVTGPKGEMRQKFSPLIDISLTDNICTVTRKNDSKKARAMHGLYRALIRNLTVGVSQGYSKTLVITGVGYRAEQQGKSILFNLGYSNPIEYMIPEGLSVEIENQTRVTVSGINKEHVGQASADIRSLRPPEPYKGKGIRYENETIVRKIGKSGVK